MKTFIALFSAMFVSSANATEISCFTNYFTGGKDTKASLKLSIDENTLATASLLKVHDTVIPGPRGGIVEGFEVQNTAKLVEGTKKYAGQWLVDLGREGSGGVFSDYEAVMPKKLTAKFKIQVIERQIDSYNYNNEYYTLLCNLK